MTIRALRHPTPLVRHATLRLLRAAKTPGVPGSVEAADRRTSCDDARDALRIAVEEALPC